MPKPKILVAEPSADLRGYLLRKLKEAGYAVSAHATCTAAADLLRTDTSYELLFTTPHPTACEMDGIQLVRHAGKVAPKMKVMFLTGFSAVALQPDPQDATRHCISDPIHLRTVMAQLADFLKVA